MATTTRMPRLTERQRSILRALAAGSATADEVLGRIGAPLARSTVQGVLAALEFGRLAWCAGGPRRGQAKLYAITERGAEAIRAPMPPAPEPRPAPEREPRPKRKPRPKPRLGAPPLSAPRPAAPPPTATHRVWWLAGDGRGWRAVSEGPERACLGRLDALRKGRARGETGVVRPIGWTPDDDVIAKRMEQWSRDDLAGAGAA